MSIVQSVFDADGGHHDVLSQTTYVRRHAAMRLATCTTPARRRVTQSSSLASFARARLFRDGISVVAACTATKPTMRRAYTPRSGISAYHAGSRCSPRSWFSACHAGRGCSPRRSLSACYAGRGCSEDIVAFCRSFSSAPLLFFWSYVATYPASRHFRAYMTCRASRPPRPRPRTPP